jgi:hypothetical protein
MLFGYTKQQTSGSLDFEWVDKIIEHCH